MDLDRVSKQIVAWEDAQHEYIRIREACRLAHAEAFAASPAKTAADKKADADAKTTKLREERDHAETRAAAEWQMLLAMRGRLESSTQPGQHFGEVA